MKLTCAHEFEKACKKYSDQVAIIYLGSKITYKQLSRKVHIFSSALREFGVGQGDKVIVHGFNCPQLVIAILAITSDFVNAAVIPVNPYYSPYEIHHIIKDSGATVAVTMEEMIGNILIAGQGTSLKKIITTSLTDELNLYKRTLYDLVIRKEWKYPTSDIVIKWRDCIKLGKKAISKTLGRCQVQHDDLFTIMYTGGTTGLPKGVMHVQSTPVWSVSINEDLGVYRKNHREVVVLFAPIIHALGLFSLLLVPLLRGDTILLYPRFDLDVIFNEGQKFKATVMGGTPTVCYRMLELDRLHEYDISSLRFIFIGGDYLAPDIQKRLYDKINVPVIQMWGSTELASMLLFDDYNSPAIGSMGRASALTDVRVFDPGTLEEVSEGKTGEMFICSPTSFKGYHNLPEETASSLVQINGKEYCRTNDLVVKHGDKYFFQDRTGDILKYKGYRVSSVEIEDVIGSHSKVREVAVVGEFNPAVGDVIKAYVALLDDAQDVTPREILNWCKEKLASYKVPKIIELRDTLPKTKYGKVRKKDLRTLV